MTRIVLMALALSFGLGTAAALAGPYDIVPEEGLILKPLPDELKPHTPNLG